MTALPEGWTDFGVAAAGATAALAGLLIVAISVNVSEIIASKSAVHGARATIASLVLAIAVSLLMLPAPQTLLGLGIATIVLGLIASAIQISAIRAQWVAGEAGLTAGPRIAILALAAGQHLPFLVGGILLLVGVDTGLWWLVAGVVMVVVASLVDAWVLLIEVRR
jgi:modulator of FtsH protease